MNILLSKNKTMQLNTYHERMGISSLSDPALDTEDIHKLQNTVLAQGCSEMARFDTSFSTNIQRSQLLTDTMWEVLKANKAHRAGRKTKAGHCSLCSTGAVPSM